MRRRDFLGFAGGALICGSSDAVAQQIYRVAVLTPSQAQWQPGTFRDALQELGYREGINLRIEVVSGENDLERLPKLAAGLVATNPNVIVAVNTPGTRAAMSATSTIPIVSAVVADPVFLGIVSNIAKPEGNVTGVANLGGDITSKRIALLKEVVPSARRIALFIHPDEPIAALQILEAEKNAGPSRYRAQGVSDANRRRFAVGSTSSGPVECRGNCPAGWSRICAWRRYRTACNGKRIAFDAPATKRRRSRWANVVFCRSSGDMASHCRPGGSPAQRDTPSRASI